MNNGIPAAPAWMRTAPAPIPLPSVGHMSEGSGSRAGSVRSSADQPHQPGGVIHAPTPVPAFARRPPPPVPPPVQPAPQPLAQPPPAAELDALPSMEVAATFLEKQAQAHDSPLTAFGDVIDNCREAGASTVSRPCYYARWKLIID